MNPLIDSRFPLVLGTFPFGTALSREASFEVMDEYVERGGRLMDTAAVYGMGISEQTIGAWMKARNARHQVMISTKGGHPSLPNWEKRITEADIRGDMEQSLRDLQRDWVDIYFLHRDDESKPVEAIMPILDRLVKEGKTRFIGASNWTASRINEANAFARQNGMTEFSVSQIFWNGAVINKEGIYDPTLVAMDDIEHRGYAENGMPVMAYTSQAQGLFSHIRDKGYDGLSDGMKRTYLNSATRARAEKILQISEETGISPTAVSLAYLLHDSSVKAYPILGISRPERLCEAMEVFSLSREAVSRLFDA